MHESNRVAAGQVHFGPEVDKVTMEVLFDPQTSGGLLIGMQEPGAEALCSALCSAGYAQAAVIGTVTEDAGEEINVDGQ